MTMAETPSGESSPIELIAMLEAEVVRLIKAGSGMLTEAAKFQIRCLDTLLDHIETCFETPGEAFTWYRYAVLPIRGGRTACDLVHAGQLDHVAAYISALHRRG